MRFRFRKSVALWPGHLNATVSRRGVSLNGRLGIFSRSWGTRGRSTTIDMPGTSGIFWRREDRRRKPRGGCDTETAFLRREARERRWSAVGRLLLGMAALTLAGRAYLPNLVQDCQHEGTLWRLGVTVALMAGCYAGARSLLPSLRGAGSLPLAGVCGAGGWWLYGVLVAGTLTCS